MFSPKESHQTGLCDSHLLYKPVSNSADIQCMQHGFCSECYNTSITQVISRRQDWNFPRMQVTSSLSMGHHLPVACGPFLGSGFSKSWYFSLSLLKWEMMLLSHQITSNNLSSQVGRTRMKQSRKRNCFFLEEVLRDGSLQRPRPQTCTILGLHETQTLNFNTVTVWARVGLLLFVTRCIATCIEKP